MTPIGLAFTLSFALLVLSLPRRYAGAGIIGAVCFITEGQVIDAGVFHFTAIRIVVLAGVIRVISRGESNRLRLNKVDGMLVAYACAIAAISTVREGTMEELVYQIGILYNILLSYLVFRCLLRDERDFREVLRAAAFVIAPLALLILNECLTHRNVFSVYGDVSATDMIRDGQLRSQGPFHSPITAGAFGTTFAMLYAGLLFGRVRNGVMVMGLIASLLILMCAHSSGPFLGFGLGLVALACWPLRRYTRLIRWGIVAMLVGLQLVMKAPVWFILARASDLFGGGGYHRAYLIDQFVSRFNSWWMLGTSDTHDWFPYHLAGSGQADITNAFVEAGLSGGLVGLILCITLVARCFQRLGIGLKRIRGRDPAIERRFWGLGSTLVASIGVLLSVCYFDQMEVIWYFLLAAIAGIEIRKKQLPARAQILRPWLEQPSIAG
jgi:hypothetical protein